MIKFLSALFIVFAFMGLGCELRAEPADSILAVRQRGPTRIIKAGGNAASYAEKIAFSAQRLENMQYRGFTIILNELGNGTSEVQVFRMVVCGVNRVNSIFSSLYKSSVEFSYKYDSKSRKILQYHFLFPPNSLTGWGVPGDYAILDKLDWNEPFPSKGCSADLRIYSLEESGREYLEAGCLPDRETALRFAQRFVDYMLGRRGL